MIQTKYIAFILFILSSNYVIGQGVVNSKWVLIKKENTKIGENNRIDTAYKVTLNFALDSTYGGFSGCNSYFGIYKFSDTKLTMDSQIRTKIACNYPRGQGEFLFEFYPHVVNLKNTDDTLILYSSDSSSVVFKRVK
jgi:heat shock protein HslJ